MPACFIIRDAMPKEFACNLTRCPRVFSNVTPPNGLQPAGASRVEVKETMNSDGPIHADDDCMARRMKEVVDRISGCRAEIRLAGEGSPHPACDVWLFYEDDAARERMYDAIEWLIPEFEEDFANAALATWFCERCEHLFPGESLFKGADDAVPEMKCPACGSENIVIPERIEEGDR